MHGMTLWGMSAVCIHLHRVNMWSLLRDMYYGEVMWHLAQGRLQILAKEARPGVELGDLALGRQQRLRLPTGKQLQPQEARSRRQPCCRCHAHLPVHAEAYGKHHNALMRTLPLPSIAGLTGNRRLLSTVCLLRLCYGRASSCGSLPDLGGSHAAAPISMTCRAKHP